MLEIEAVMNARTGHTVNINLSTDSIHRDNQEQIFQSIQNSQNRSSPCEKEKAWNNELIKRHPAFFEIQQMPLFH